MNNNAINAINATNAIQSISKQRGDVVVDRINNPQSRNVFHQGGDRVDVVQLYEHRLGDPAP